MQQLKKMGPLENIVGMMPDLPPGADPSDVDESRLVRMEAIITSMTSEERNSPAIIDGSRRSRIAKGSGTSVQEVSLLLKQFKEIKRMMKGSVKPRKKNKRKGSNKRKKSKPSSRVKQRNPLDGLDSATTGEFDLSDFGTFSN